MQSAATLARTPAAVSDRALARHFVALAEQALFEGDHRLAQHFLDLVHDLYDTAPGSAAAAKDKAVDIDTFTC